MHLVKTQSVSLGIAAPEPTILPLVRMVRTLLEYDPSFKEVAGDPSLLAGKIAETWPKLADKAEECASYLHRELEVLKQHAPGLVVTAPTGEALCILPQDAYCDLPSVMREDGKLVKRGYGIRPTVEAAIAMQWYTMNEDTKYKHLPLGADANRTDFLKSLPPVKDLLTIPGLRVRVEGPWGDNPETYVTGFRMSLSQLRIASRFDVALAVKAGLAKSLVDTVIARHGKDLPSVPWHGLPLDLTVYTSRDGQKIAFQGPYSMILHGGDEFMALDSACFSGDWFIKATVKLSHEWNPSTVRVAGLCGGLKPPIQAPMSS